MVFFKCWTIGAAVNPHKDPQELGTRYCDFWDRRRNSMDADALQRNQTAAARKRERLTKLREIMARIPDDKKEMAKIVLVRKLREIGDAKLKKSEMLKKFREVMERLPDDKKEMVKIVLEGMLKGIQGGDSTGIQDLRDFLRSKACLPDEQNETPAALPPPSVSRPRKRKACLISS